MFAVPFGLVLGRAFDEVGFRFRATGVDEDDAGGVSGVFVGEFESGAGGGVGERRVAAADVVVEGLAEGWAGKPFGGGVVAWGFCGRCQGGEGGEGEERDETAHAVEKSGRRESGDRGAEFGEFELEAAAEDGEAAPCFGVEVGVVDVEAWGVAFAFPLIAAPEGEETFDPCGELGGGVLGEVELHEFPDIERGLFVADGGAFDGVEERVGHEIVLVGLV